MFEGAKLDTPGSEGFDERWNFKPLKPGDRIMCHECLDSYPKGVPHRDCDVIL